MNYTVKPPGPELAGTFTEYLGGLDFGHAPHWAGCFCAFYYSDCSQEVWMKRTGPWRSQKQIPVLTVFSQRTVLYWKDV